MKTLQMAGWVAAVVLAGSVAAWAQAGGPDGHQGPEGDRPEGGGGCGGAPMMGEGNGPGPRGPMERPRGINPDLAKKAGATEAQIKALLDFDLEQQVKRIDLQAAAEKAELKLNALMRSGEADEKTVLQAADTLNQARGELYKLHLVAMLKVKQVLGADVERKMRELGHPAFGERRALRDGKGAPHDGSGADARHDAPRPPADLK